MSELERDLRALASAIDWPAHADLSAGVDRALRAAPDAPLRRRPGRPIYRSLALALAGLLLAAGGVVAAVPELRNGVLKALGLRGATIERRRSLPPLPAAGPLDLGSRLSLQEARRALGFEPVLPSALGRPDAVYLRRTTPGGELALAYRRRPGLPAAAATGLGLLVTEFRGDLDPRYVGKIVPMATTVERLRIRGSRAVWIAGAPHVFFYRTPKGAFREDTLRLAGNVLLVQRRGLLVRYEGAFSRRRAIALARSLR